MNRKIQNKLAKYSQVIGVFNQTRAIWESNAGFSAQVEKLIEKKLLVEELMNKLGEGTFAKTREKHKVLKSLSDKVLHLRGCLTALSVERKDVVLEAKIPKLLSDITRAAARARLQTMSVIIDLGETEAEALSVFGWTADHQKACQEAYEAAHAMLGAPVAKRRENSAILNKVKLNINDMDVLINDVLNGLMLGFKEEHLDFYDSFTRAMSIIDVRASRKSNQEKEALPENTIESDSDENGESPPFEEDEFNTSGI